MLVVGLRGGEEEEEEEENSTLTSNPNIIIPIKSRPNSNTNTNPNLPSPCSTLSKVQGTISGFMIPSWMLGALSGPSKILCTFISGDGEFGGEVGGFETDEGTFSEWATSDHFRFGFVREEGD